jgi:hypothetical protein
MTLSHVQLESLARQVCEGRRGAGSYDRKGCKRAHWRKRAQAMYDRVHAQPAAVALYRACGWKI